MNFLKDSLSLVSNWSLLNSSLNTDTSDFFQNGDQLNQYKTFLSTWFWMNEKLKNRIFKPSWWNVLKVVNKKPCNRIAFCSYCINLSEISIQKILFSTQKRLAMKGFILNVIHHVHSCFHGFILRRYSIMYVCRLSDFGNGSINIHKIWWITKLEASWKLGRPRYYTITSWSPLILTVFAWNRPRIHRRSSASTYILANSLLHFAHPFSLNEYWLSL